MTDRVCTPATVIAMATHRFIAPEIGGQMFTRTEPADQFLESLADWADDDPDELPATLHRPASDALGDLRLAINNARYRRLHTPGGSPHEPLAIVALPAPTITTYHAAVLELARAWRGDGTPRVADAVTEFAAEWHCNPAELVELAARLYHLCAMEWGPEHDIVAGALEHAPTSGTRVRLTDEQEAAYRHLQGRFAAIWPDANPDGCRLY